MRRYYQGTTPYHPNRFKPATGKSRLLHDDTYRARFLVLLRSPHFLGSGGSHSRPFGRLHIARQAKASAAPIDAKHIPCTISEHRYYPTSFFHIIKWTPRIQPGSGRLKLASTSNQLSRHVSQHRGTNEQSRTGSHRSSTLTE